MLEIGEDRPLAVRHCQRLRARAASHCLVALAAVSAARRLDRGDPPAKGARHRLSAAADARVAVVVAATNNTRPSMWRPERSASAVIRLDMDLLCHISFAVQIAEFYAKASFCSPGHDEVQQAFSRASRREVCAAIGRGRWRPNCAARAHYCLVLSHRRRRGRLSSSALWGIPRSHRWRYPLLNSFSN